MEVHGADWKVPFGRAMNIAIRIWELQIQPTMRKHEKFGFVILRRHGTQQFFAVITDAGFSSVKNCSVKCDLHAFSRAASKMRNRSASSSGTHPPIREREKRQQPMRRVEASIERIRSLPQTRSGQAR